MNVSPLFYEIHDFFNMGITAFWDGRNALGEQVVSGAISTS